MSPKSLLRHRLAVSPLREFTDGTFRLVIDEADPLDREKVKRVLFCSGKVYYTLLQARRQRDLDSIAIVRVEQLYPFAARPIGDILAAYPQAQDIRWVQEEPANMGAWSFVRPRLEPLLGEHRSLGYNGPDEAASPAPGNYKVHAREEAEFVDRALERVDRPMRTVRPRVEAVGGRRDR
jgi:2-oxoglutarate dehydrogenase E1 component